MSGRATAVLQRFPRHLGLTDPGKRAGAVAGAVADDLDELSRVSGQVRRAHRIAAAPTRLDLERIASLHRIDERDLALVSHRLGHLRAVAAAAPADTDALAAASGTRGDDLAEADPDELAGWVEGLTGLDRELDLLRAVVLGTVSAHRLGNGTARALLIATGVYLGLEPRDVRHAPDRWWHTTTATDALAAGAPAAAGDDWMALEENPFVPGGVAPVERAHGDRFRILRGGLEAVDVSVEVTGLADRTVAPMVVNLDAGRGVVYDDVVPDGATLAFSATGPVALDGLEVTGAAFAFSGAVFAAGPPGETKHPRDFVFADADAGDRSATFVTTAPLAGGFAAGLLPHGAAAVPALPMAVGESRWAFFVRRAHFSAGPRVVPTFLAGRWDGSVFAGGGAGPAGLVGFSWEEREPFAVRVLLPQRLADADDDEGSLLRQPLRSLLERHVAAGVHVYVEYADDRWVLGSGILRATETTEAIGTVVDGTALWGTATEPPPD